jgi:hypothetical protein
VNPAHDHTLQIEAVLRQIPTHTHHYDIIIGMPTIVEYDLLSFLRQRWHGNRDGEAEPGDLGGAMTNSIAMIDDHQPSTDDSPHDDDMYSLERDESQTWEAQTDKGEEEEKYTREPCLPEANA